MNYPNPFNKLKEVKQLVQDQKGVSSDIGAPDYFVQGKRTNFHDLD